jgi:general secretion pathway protein A
MYLEAWGPPASPYSVAPASAPFRTPAFEEALARLHYLVDARRRLGLLLGSAGSGKTVVLETFARELARRPLRVARVPLCGLESREFLWAVAAELGLGPGRNDGVFELSRLLTDHLIENRYQHTSTVLLLDDADEAGDAAGRGKGCGAQVLAQVARLAEVDLSPRPGLTIVLAARPERTGRLGGRILELAELKIELDPWSEGETQKYLSQRVPEHAGSPPSFAPQAASRLHALAHGVPRRISQLANLALVAAAGQGLDSVDPDLVEGVYRELGLIPTWEQPG